MRRHCFSSPDKEQGRLLSAKTVSSVRRLIPLGQQSGRGGGFLAIQPHTTPRSSGKVHPVSRTRFFSNHFHFGQTNIFDSKVRLQQSVNNIPNSWSHFISDVAKCLFTQLASFFSTQTVSLFFRHTVPKTIVSILCHNRGYFAIRNHSGQ